MRLLHLTFVLIIICMYADPFSRTGAKDVRSNAMPRRESLLERKQRLSDMWSKMEEDEPMEPKKMSLAWQEMLDAKPAKQDKTSLGGPGRRTSIGGLGRRPSLFTTNAKTLNSMTTEEQDAFLANLSESKQQIVRSPLLSKLGEQIESEFQDQADQVEEQLELTQRASRHSLAAKLQRRSKRLSGTPSPQKSTRRLSNAWASFLSDTEEHSSKVQHLDRRKSDLLESGIELDGDDLQQQHPTYDALAPVAIAGGPAKGGRMSEAWGHFFQAAHEDGVQLDGDDSDVGGGNDGVEADGRASLLFEGQAVEQEFEDQSRAVDDQIEQSRRDSALVLSQKLQRRASAILVSGGGVEGAVEEEEVDSSQEEDVDVVLETEASVVSFPAYFTEPAIPPNGQPAGLQPLGARIAPGMQPKKLPKRFASRAQNSNPKLGQNKIAPKFGMRKQASANPLGDNKISPKFGMRKQASGANNP